VAGDDERSSREPVLDTPHVARPQRYAAGGRLQIFVGKMKKDSAAATYGARRDIIIQYADDIVEAILTPEIFAGASRGKAHKAVVIARGRVVAPAVARPDAALAGEAAAPAVQSPQPSQDFQAPHGGHAVAFPAFDAETAAADGAFDQLGAHAQQASGPLRAPRKLLNKKNVDFRPRSAAAFQHGVLTAGTRKRRFLTCHGFARWCWRDVKRGPSRT